jgi:hypothetical protein
VYCGEGRADGACEGGQSVGPACRRRTPPHFPRRRQRTSEAHSSEVRSANWFRPIVKPRSSAWALWLCTRWLLASKISRRYADCEVGRSGGGETGDEVRWSPPSYRRVRGPAGARTSSGLEYVLLRGGGRGRGGEGGCVRRGGAKPQGAERGGGEDEVGPRSLRTNSRRCADPDVEGHAVVLELGGCCGRQGHDECGSGAHGECMAKKCR